MDAALRWWRAAAWWPHAAGLLAMALAAAAWVWLALPTPPAPVPDAATLDRVLAHGPWPAAAEPDPRNPVAGQPAAVAFGEALFHSARLSRVSGVRCASCHEPWRSFTDGRDRAFGASRGDRNTPSVLNVALQRRFGWDGARDSLWAQSIRPILDPREMGADAASVAASLRADARLSAMYRASFGKGPGEGDDDKVLLDAAQALAAYQATLISPRTPFDTLRDAWAHGDQRAAAAYPAAARRGLLLFVGKAACAGCHSGPGFSDGQVHRSAIGPGAWRTPGLREVARTAPYMHDGRFAQLCDTIAPHAVAGPAAAPSPARPAAALTRAEREDIVAFLRTLASGEEPPDATAGLFRCGPAAPG